MENKTAQDLLDETISNSDENLKMFYPKVHQQKQVDENITKCLRDLK